MKKAHISEKGENIYRKSSSCPIIFSILERMIYKFLLDATEFFFKDTFNW